MDKEIRKMHLEKIKKVFKENFVRELSDDEANNYLEDLLIKTGIELEKIPGITEKDKEKYMSKEVNIVFSPNAVNKEAMRIIGEIGIEKLEESSKYKKLGEMVDASCFALALKKQSGREWVIKLQDSPDILLISRNNSEFSSKPFDAISLEIMQIPENEKSKFQDVELSVANFIKEKKFLKRYNGIPHLLVHLNFDQSGFKLECLSEKMCELAKASKIPFHQIWVRLNTDPDSKTMILACIYPSFAHIDFNFYDDRNLMF